MIFSNANKLPIQVIVVFNIFTLFIFLTAPINWATNNLYLFLFFAVFCQATIWFGYKLGYSTSLKRQPYGKVLKNLTNNQLTFFFVFYGFTFLVKYAYLLGFHPLDISGMYKFLMIGINDPRIGYNLAISDKTFYVSWTAYFLTSLINQIFFIIGFFYFKRMRWIKKTLFVIFVSIDLFSWMGRGTNFGVITMITTLTFISLLKINAIKLTYKNKPKVFLGLAILLGISLYAFSYNMNSRAGGNTIDLQYFGMELSNVDENGTALKILPESLHQSYMYVVSYLTQGYFHTSLAFDLDFESTFLLGNNPALIELVKFFNIDIWQNTYMYRLSALGVDPLVRWHSAYLWYASDVSFLGVPFLLMFIGYILGVSWGLANHKGDFLSMVIYVINANILLFLFANNSYLSSIFYSYMLFFPLWFFTRLVTIKIKL